MLEQGLNHPRVDKFDTVRRRRMKRRNLPRQYQPLATVEFPGTCDREISSPEKIGRRKARYGHMPDARVSPRCVRLDRAIGSRLSRRDSVALNNRQQGE
jgi:hypothetical protein